MALKLSKQEWEHSEGIPQLRLARQKQGDRIAKLELERVQLTMALYDCVNSPKGVVPDTAAKFYNET